MTNPLSPFSFSPVTPPRPPRSPYAPYLSLSPDMQTKAAEIIANTYGTPPHAYDAYRTPPRDYGTPTQETSPGGTPKRKRSPEKTPRPSSPETNDTSPAKKPKKLFGAEADDESPFVLGPLLEEDETNPSTPVKLHLGKTQSTSSTNSDDELSPDSRAFQIRRPPSAYKAPPPAPIRQAPRRQVPRPDTPTETLNKVQLEQAEALYDLIGVAYKEIGKKKGHFHNVYEINLGAIEKLSENPFFAERPHLIEQIVAIHKQYALQNKATVLKTPNKEELDASRRNWYRTPKCIQEVINAHDNYVELHQAKALGHIPAGLDFAETRFDRTYGIIAQEKWDRPFDPKVDMLKPEVVELVKTMLQKLANKEIPKVDFKADNLGWKDGKLMLFDFVEESDYEPELTIKNFARTFVAGLDPVTAKRIYEHILPPQVERSPKSVTKRTRKG